MKRPFEAITEMFFDNLDRVKENQKFNFSNSEKYMIWVVGFSVGGLAIIVTNLTSFNTLFSHKIIKTVLILLSTSIIAGMIYRWAFYFYQIYYQSTEFQLRAAFSNTEIMEIDADDLASENDINEVVRRIKTDFGEDVSHVLEIYEGVDETGKTYLLNDLKKHYKKTGERVKKEFEFSIKYVKDVYRSAFGWSEKRIEKVFNTQVAEKLRFWGLTVSIAFLVSCLSFITVLILLTVLY
jgi:hypothetical protein